MIRIRIGDRRQKLYKYRRRKVIKLHTKRFIRQNILPRRLATSNRQTSAAIIQVAGAI